MESLLRNIPYVVIYQDDITIIGLDLKSHVDTLKNVLGKLKLAGLQLNKEKCMFFKNKIKYLGLNIDKDGLSKNKERVSCVLNAPNPRNISEVRAFTGMVS